MSLHDARSGTELARTEFDGEAAPERELFNGIRQSPSPNGPACFDPQGRLLVGCIDGTLRIFDARDLSTRPQLAEFEAKKSEIRTLVCNPTGTRLLIGHRDGTARLVDASTGALLREFEHEGYRGWRAVTAAGFSPDGQLLLIGGGGGNVTLWDTETGNRVHRLEQHRAPGIDRWHVWSTRFSPDGTLAMCTGSDGRARLYDTATWNRIEIYGQSHIAWFTPDGQDILCARPGELRRRRLVDMVVPMDLGARGSGSVVEVRFSVEGTHAFVVEYDAIRKWDLRDGSQSFARYARDDDPRCLAVDPAGDLVAVGRLDRRIVLLDAETGAERGMLEAPADLPRPEAGKQRIGFARVQFSPNSRLLAGAFGTFHYPRDPEVDTPIVLFDAQTQEVRHILRGHRSVVREIAFDANGSRLASSGGTGNPVIVWDVERGTPIWKVESERGSDAIRFSPDGQRVVIGEGGWIHVRDAENGESIRRFRAHAAGPISDFAFCDGGRRLVTVSRARALAVWDTVSWQRLLHVPFGGPEAGRPKTVAVSPDSRRILVGIADERRVLLLDPDADAATKLAQRRHNETMRVFDGLSVGARSAADVKRAAAERDDLDPQELQRLQEFTDSLVGTPYPWLTWSAVDLRRSGDIDAAIARYREALAVRPDSPFYRWTFAAFLESCGAYEKARPEYERALELDPLLTEAHLGLASLAANRFDEASALRHAARALELDPDQRDLAELSDIYLRFGMLGDAVHLAGRGLARRENANGYNTLATRYSRYRDFETAIRWYRKGLELAPSEPNIHANLSHAYRHLGQFAEAIDYGRKAVKLEPRFEYTLAMALQASGRSEEALQHFDSIMSNPWATGRPVGLDESISYGLALADVGRATDAKRWIEALTNAWPLEPYAWHEHAMVLATAPGMTPADRQQAVQIAERGVELSNRRSPVMLATLAEALFRNGNAAAAVTTAEEVLTLMNGANVEWLALDDMQNRLARYRGD